MHKINIADAFARFDDAWNPRLAGEVNDFQVRMVRLRGLFEWHHHETEDELFLVVDGLMRMHFREGPIDVSPGEFIIVPHGVEHCPEAPCGDCQVLLFERASTVNTGNVVTIRTLSAIEALPSA